MMNITLREVTRGEVTFNIKKIDEITWISGATKPVLGFVRIVDEKGVSIIRPFDFQNGVRNSELPKGEKNRLLVWLSNKFDKEMERMNNFNFELI